MAHAVHDHAGVTTLVDDCWNRIGTRGDQSCPRLPEYARCLNCPVFEEGAAALLDRALSDADLEAAALAHRTAAPLRTLEQAGAELAVLVFRIADEWLALPATALRQIDTPRAIHTLPHRRNRVVLGLVNIRGALTVAVSLGELLGWIKRAASTPGAMVMRGSWWLRTAMNRPSSRWMKWKACCAFRPPRCCRCRPPSRTRPRPTHAAYWRGAMPPLACLIPTACSTRLPGACDEHG